MIIETTQYLKNSPHSYTDLGRYPCTLTSTSTSRELLDISALSEVCTTDNSCYITKEGYISCCKFWAGYLSLSPFLSLSFYNVTP